MTEQEVREGGGAHDVHGGSSSVREQGQQLEQQVLPEERIVGDSVLAEGDGEGDSRIHRVHRESARVRKHGASARTISSMRKKTKGIVAEREATGRQLHTSIAQQVAESISSNNNTGTLCKRSLKNDWNPDHFEC